MEVQDLRVLVGDRAALRAKATERLRDGVERRLQRPQIRMRGARVAAVAIVGVFAPMELRVDALGRVAVERLELRAQAVAVDPGPSASSSMVSARMSQSGSGVPGSMLPMRKLSRSPPSKMMWLGMLGYS